MTIVLRLLSILGLKSRWHRHFSPRPLNKVFFQGGRDVGFVDSWPETLVPSASNRSTAEWTLVDSRQARFDEQQLRGGARQSVPTSSAWQCRHTAGWPVGTPIHCSSWAPPLTIHADQWTNGALIESQATSRRWLVPSSSSSSAHLGCHA